MIFSFKRKFPHLSGPGRRVKRCFTKLKVSQHLSGWRREKQKEEIRKSGPEAASHGSNSTPDPETAGSRGWYSLIFKVGLLRG
jgi:hypothetical protein